MIKTLPSLKLLLCSIGIMLVITFVVKYLYTQLIYFNSGLLIVLLITLFIGKDIITYIFSLLSVLMILYSLSIYNIKHNEELVIQQLLALGAVLITTVLVISIKKLYRTIHKEKQQLNALLQYTPMGTIITDLNGKIIFMNPAALRLYNYTEKELADIDVDMLVPQRFRMLHEKFRSEFIEKIADSVNEQSFDMHAETKDGHEFPVHITLNYYYQDKICFILSFVNDVTERKESEEKLIQQREQLEKVTHDVRRMNTELENKVAERTLILREALLELEKSQTELSDALNKEKELNEIKSRFVSMASHEFRTPLSAILSSASLISKYQYTENQDKRDKHIQRIKGSVKHLNDLLEDFLNLGKLEQGRVFVNAEPFDVKECLMDVFEELKHSLKKGQHLDLSYNGEINFTTDQRLLKNIMINLLSNAVKFSDENKLIRISVENLGLKMIIHVKDEGIGISQEDMPYLFSTFYRAKNAINIQGTGLGLNIVKRYIDMLGGEISVSSELGNGCTFTISVPGLFETV
jgi:PAS domain S-box-containing protein